MTIIAYYYYKKRNIVHLHNLRLRLHYCGGRFPHHAIVAYGITKWRSKSNVGTVSLLDMKSLFIIWI